MQLRHCCHGQLDSTDIGAEQRTHHMDGAQEGRQSSAEHMEVAPADMDTLEEKKIKINEKTIPVPGLRYDMCVFIS